MCVLPAVAFLDLEMVIIFTLTLRRGMVYEEAEHREAFRGGLQQLERAAQCITQGRWEAYFWNTVSNLFLEHK